MWADFLRRKSKAEIDSPGNTSWSEKKKIIPAQITAGAKALNTLIRGFFFINKATGDDKKPPSNYNT